MALHLGDQRLGDREFVHASHRSVPRPIRPWDDSAHARRAVRPVSRGRSTGGQSGSGRYAVPWNSTAVQAAGPAMDAEDDGAGRPPGRDGRWHTSFWWTTTRTWSHGTGPRWRRTGTG